MLSILWIKCSKEFIGEAAWDLMINEGDSQKKITIYLQDMKELGIAYSLVGKKRVINWLNKTEDGQSYVKKLIESSPTTLVVEKKKENAPVKKNQNSWAINNIKICSIEGCEEVVRARGWCDKHLKRWYSTGSPMLLKKTKKCIEPDCERLSSTRGMCRKHYVSWYNKNLKKRNLQE
ncbi:hypothetical protein [Paenibacillus sp. FSL P4-0288]|uniref:hypothetical protein n=1 Tax=Paenibacillus sp. FSL P4-0288 TaxID=2921633 RepID=UPI0030FB8CC5